MENVIEINRSTTFSLSDAQNLLPVVLRITKSYKTKVDALIERLESLGGRDDGLANELETQINSLIQSWQNKVQKLGAVPKGLWIADFDAGDGYYCWKFPEALLGFWHKYDDGYSKRVPIEQRDQIIPLYPRFGKKLGIQSPIQLPPAEFT